MATDPPAAAPEGFQALSLRASLTASDLRKSLAWYHEVVGFAIENRYERDGKLMSVGLRAGDVRILIGQDKGDEGGDRVRGAGFSLMIITAQDVDQVARGIEARGGVLDTEPADMPWGARMFRLRDPDGFWLTISSDR